MNKDSFTSLQCILFNILFLAILHWLEYITQYWTKVVGACTFVLSLISREMCLLLLIKYEVSARNFISAFNEKKEVPVYSLFVEYFSQRLLLNFSVLFFSPSFEITIWFFFFQCTEWQRLLFLYWIKIVFLGLIPLRHDAFNSILFRILASMFRRDVFVCFVLFHDKSIFQDFQFSGFKDYVVRKQVEMF